MGEEGLAVAGVAEYEDEPGFVGRQPLDYPVKSSAINYAGHAIDPADPLRHIQLRQVVRVGA